MKDRRHATKPRHSSNSAEWDYILSMFFSLAVGAMLGATIALGVMAS